MPNARPWRTSRSSSSAASWAILSSSTKNSWNSSTISRMRGSGSPALAVAIAGEVLHAGVAEQLAAALQLGVEPLQHAQAELALALDGDHPGVRQLVRGVGLELDALLEVDQVELDLVGAVAQRQVGDQRVQQRRFAGAGLAGDQDVLRRALAELQVLQLAWRRPGRAARRCRRGCRRSTSRSGGGAMNSNGTSTRLASLGRLADHVAAMRVMQRRPAAAASSVSGNGRSRRPSRRSASSFQARSTLGCSRSSRSKPCGIGCRGVDADQRVDAAAGAAGGDADQPAGRLRR